MGQPFRVGQRVTATDRYITTFPAAPTAGVVVAVAPGGTLYVLRDGLRSATGFAPSYWQLEPTPPELAAWVRECETIS